LILAIILLALLIVTLVHQAKHGKWKFFILTLILTLVFGLGTIMILIYWIYWWGWGKKRKQYG